MNINLGIQDKSKVDWPKIPVTPTLYPPLEYGHSKDYHEEVFNKGQDNESKCSPNGKYPTK